MKRFTTHITEAQLNEENCSCCDNKIDADGKCGCGPDCEHCGGQHDVDEGSCGTVNASKKTVKEAGLWDNIHAKRKRIKNGSGEKMKKPGSKGAPTDQDFKDASESVELDEMSPADKKRISQMYDKKGNLTPLGKKVMDHGKKAADAKVADKARRKEYNAYQKSKRNEEAELEEAPKMTGDSIKIQRAKDAEHNAAMGRTKTGRKKPVRTMTSTQRSLASMREDLNEERQSYYSSKKHAYKPKNNSYDPDKVVTQAHLQHAHDFHDHETDKGYDRYHTTHLTVPHHTAQVKHLHKAMKANAKDDKAGLEKHMKAYHHGNENHTINKTATYPHAKHLPHHGESKDVNESVYLDESIINQLCADYINENNIDPAVIENMTEEELNEFIGKAIGGAVRLGAKAVIGTARLAGKGAKRAVTTKQGSFRGTRAARQDKAGDRAEKMAKKREADAKRAERIRNAQDRSDAADARLSDLKKNK